MTLPMEADAFVRALWSTEYRFVVFGSSLCSTKGIVMHRVNALDLVDVYLQLAVSTGRV